MQHLGTAQYTLPEGVALARLPAALIGKVVAPQGKTIAAIEKAVAT